MIWMTWRQFRAQALVGVVALALIAAYLIYLGFDIRHAYDTFRARCQAGTDCGPTMDQFAADYENTMLYLAALVGLIPGLIGMFWGAPLITRELEAGTHRLVWNQGVTRRRWLGVKIVVIGFASVVLAGVISVLMTWAASPVDQIADDRFSTILFGARNVVPLAYALFAFVLGTAVGLLMRRTVPAMALTVLLFIVGQFFVANVVRPHLVPARTMTIAMTADAINSARGLGSITGGAVIKGVMVPGVWVTDVSEMRTADGKTLANDTFDDCFVQAPKTGATGTFGDIAVCLSKLNLHVDVAYQPHDRYWTFQWLETAVYGVLTLLLVFFGLWRIRRLN